jgi:hypothetical protein
VDSELVHRLTFQHGVEGSLFGQSKRRWRWPTPPIGARPSPC